MLWIPTIDPETHVGELMGERAAHIGEGMGGATPGGIAAGGACARLAAYSQVMVVAAIQKLRWLVTASGLRVCV